jgi:hypothetical protein
MIYKIFIFSIFFSLSILSCKKEAIIPIETPVKYGNMLLKFDNRIGKEELVLNVVTYQNKFGENFTLSQVNYFISRVVLSKSDGTKFIVPKDNCQFLMREDDFFQQWFLLKNIPEGSYKSVSFSLGVENPNLQNPIFDKNKKGKELFYEGKNEYAAFFIKGNSVTKDSFEYKIPSPKSLKIIDLSFGEYVAEVKENAKNYSTSAHIFCDLSKFFNTQNFNNPLSVLQEQSIVETLFEVNHIENK